jgi:hypothetical protein
MMTAQEAKTAVENYALVRGLWGAISANRLHKVIPALTGKTPMEAVEVALQDEAVFNTVNPFLEAYRKDQEQDKLVRAEALRIAKQQVKLARQRANKAATIKSLLASGVDINVDAFVQADPELAKLLA